MPRIGETGNGALSARVLSGPRPFRPASAPFELLARLLAAAYSTVP